MRCDARTEGPRSSQCRLKLGHDVHKGNGESWIAEAGYDTIAAARREGVIEGLEKALEWVFTKPPVEAEDAIRAEIERLKGA